MKDAGEFGAKAQEITGTCTVSYKLNNNKITEKQLPIIIEIAETPILSLNGQIPESEIGGKVNGKINTNFEFFQSTDEKSLSLKFKNEGNIDLKNVEVELYTENSEFFYKSSFYYDENNYGTKQYYGEKIELGDIAIGQSETKLFTINMKDNLPPGLYKIPIKYTAAYNREGILDVDLSVNDFHEKITAARMWNNKGYTPFILVNILEGDDSDDNIEPDLLAYSTTSLQQGMNRVLLEVELTNLERYRLNNVNAYISVGGSSPIRPLNELNNTPITIDAQEKNFLIYGYSDSEIPQTFFVHFLVDIDNNASSGMHKVPITLTCLDNYNQERTTIVFVALYIKPVPPSLVISDVSTTDIRSNETFFLTVKVYNCGGSEAKNVKLMFNGSSNLFSAQNIFQEVSSIKKGKEVEFNFAISAGEVELGKTYTSSVLISYEDILGNYYSFTSNAKNTIPLKVNTDKVETEQKEPLLRPRFVLSDLTTTDIVPNNNFTLTIKLYNYGERSAINLYIMFNESSNLFSAADSIYGPNFIKENTKIKYDYTIMAGEVEPGGVYTSSFLLSYSDLVGNFYNFYENPSLSIKLYVKEKEETSPDSIIEAQKNETGVKYFKAEESDVFDISNGFAMIILGLFILISSIIFSVIHYKVGKTPKTQKHQESQEIKKNQEPGKTMDQPRDTYIREQIMPTNHNLDKDPPKVIHTIPTSVPTTVTTSTSTSSVPSLPPASVSVTKSTSTSASTPPKPQQQKPYLISQSTQQIKPIQSPSISSSSISPKYTKYS